MRLIINLLILEKYIILYVLFAEQSVLKTTVLYVEPLTGTIVFTLSKGVHQSINCLKWTVWSCKKSTQILMMTATVETALRMDTAKIWILRKLQ